MNLYVVENMRDKAKSKAKKMESSLKSRESRLEKEIVEHTLISSFSHFEKQSDGIVKIVVSLLMFHFLGVLVIISSI